MRLKKMLLMVILFMVIFIGSEQKIEAKDACISKNYTSEGQTCVYIDEEIKQTSQSSDFTRGIMIIISAFTGSFAITLLLLNVLKDDNDKEDQKK